jgi:DNA-binding CsgD family transcriptional regulator
MRQWTPSHHGNTSAQVLPHLIGLVGQAEFESALLQQLHPMVPAASYSIYQTGSGCAPELFMSASLGIPDTTRACWNAYLTGPHLEDRTLSAPTMSSGQTLLCHILAPEVPLQHRTRVYEAHGMAERISVVQQQDASVFAINFYRHTHQTPFSDAQLANFESLAPALLSLAHKQIQLRPPSATSATPEVSRWTHRLMAFHPGLTTREVSVCARLLMGMTQDGIARDLGLSLPTVKTYRNRAFSRLGIHFKSQLFALFTCA